MRASVLGTGHCLPVRARAAGDGARAEAPAKRHRAAAAAHAGVQPAHVRRRAGPRRGAARQVGGRPRGRRAARAVGRHVDDTQLLSRPTRGELRRRSRSERTSAMVQLTREARAELIFSNAPPSLTPRGGHTADGAGSSVAGDGGGAAQDEEHVRQETGAFTMVARWQNLIPSFPWIAPGWRAWGRNPRKGRDQILQRSVAEP